MAERGLKHHNKDAKKYSIVQKRKLIFHGPSKVVKNKKLGNEAGNSCDKECE